MILHCSNQTQRNKVAGLKGISSMIFNRFVISGTTFCHLLFSISATLCKEAPLTLKSHCTNVQCLLKAIFIVWPDSDGNCFSRRHKRFSTFTVVSLWFLLPSKFRMLVFFSHCPHKNPRPNCLLFFDKHQGPVVI